MHNNYPARLEMQIPQENAYTGLNIKSNFNIEFEELSKYYNIHEESNVKIFIKEHENILPFIQELTPLINEYFPKYEKIIEFCKDPEFSDLDFIMIYINGESYEMDYKKLVEFKNEPLYMSKFSKKINGLVCVELW